MQTIKFSATVGVNEGYQSQNSLSDYDTASTVSLVWQQKAEQVYRESGIYISAIVSPAKAVYHTDWGCPLGGENIALISGECNPEFTNVEPYKESVLKVLGLVKEELKQSTVQISFAHVELVYIK